MPVLPYPLSQAVGVLTDLHREDVRGNAKLCLTNPAPLVLRPPVGSAGLGQNGFSVRTMTKDSHKRHQDGKNADN